MRIQIALIVSFVSAIFSKTFNVKMRLVDSQQNIIQNELFLEREVHYIKYKDFSENFVTYQMEYERYPLHLFGYSSIESIEENGMFTLNPSARPWFYSFVEEIYNTLDMGSLLYSVFYVSLYFPMFYMFKKVSRVNTRETSTEKSHASLVEEIIIEDSDSDSESESILDMECLTETKSLPQNIPVIKKENVYPPKSNATPIRWFNSDRQY